MKKLMKMTGALAVVLAMIFTLNSFTSRKDNPQIVEINRVAVKNYSAKVHLTLADGKDVYRTACKAYFKGWDRGWMKFETDKNGCATLNWTSDQGEIINSIAIIGDINYKARHKDGLNIKDGGSYEIVMD